MTNSLEFRSAMIRAGYDQKRLARELKISENSLSRKITNQNEFKVSEILLIQKIFEIDDFQRNVIFFNRKCE